MKENEEVFPKVAINWYNTANAKLSSNIEK